MAIENSNVGKEADPNAPQKWCGSEGWIVPPSLPHHIFALSFCVTGSKKIDLLGKK